MSLYKESEFCEEMIHSKNFIDQAGKHPDPGLAIYGHNIVFSKEELTDGKWIFCNEDPLIIKSARIQVDTLLFYKTWIAIID